MKPFHFNSMLLLLCVCTSLAVAQTIGDFKSNATGYWNSTSTWQTWNGTTWVAAISTPTATNTVYLDDGPVITLTQDESCGDLHLRCAPLADKLVTGAFTLSVNGKLRAFTGAAPGTSSTSLPSSTTWINTRGGGKISIIGNTRVIINTGEWAANPPGWTIEFALNAGQTATINTNFKAAKISVVSGTLSLPTGDLRADSTAAGTGTITVNSGARLSLGQGSITRTTTAATGYCGSVIINGTLAYPRTTVGSINSNIILFNGTVEYSAAGAQTLVQKTSGGGGAAIPNTYSNLSISGSGLKTLSTVTTVAGAITFGGSANLVLAAFNLTVGSSIVGAGPGNALVTNGSGSVIRAIPGPAGLFQYPLSTDGTDYSPLTVSLGMFDPTETFSVKVTPGVSPSAPFDPSAVQRTWTITEGTPGGNSVILTFQWAGAQEGSWFNRSGAGVWRHNGTDWIEMGTSAVSGSDPYAISVDGISTFSPFLVGNHGILPITLSSFTGSLSTNGSAQLEWSTISEINNFGFEVERAAIPSGPYTTVSALIRGHGTTNVPQHYSFTDASPLSGTSYYRLRQIDLDHSVHISESVAVSAETAALQVAPKVFALSQNYPNPFNPKSDIRFAVERDARATLRLYNAIGQEVTTLFDGWTEPGKYYQTTVDGSTLSSGVYFYRLESGGKSDMKKAVILK